jgi:hypothetical protein
MCGLLLLGSLILNAYLYLTLYKMRDTYNHMVDRYFDDIQEMSKRD